MLVSGIDFSVALAEHVGRDRVLHGFIHFVLGWPNVREIDGFAIFAGSKGVFAQIHIHAASQRKRHDQWRRHQIIGAHIGIDASLKIPISREHGSYDEVLAVHFFCNLLRQRSGVSDAGGTAVANDMKF